MMERSIEAYARWFRPRVGCRDAVIDQNFPCPRPGSVEPHPGPSQTRSGHRGRAVRVVKSTRRRLATEPSGSALGGAGSSLSRPWATCAAAGGREGGLGGAEGPILTFCCLVSACFWLEIFFPLHVVFAIALRRQATGACILRRHAPGGTRARDRVQADEYRLVLVLVLQAFQAGNWTRPGGIRQTRLVTAAASSRHSQLGLSRGLSSPL
jgi:hypothetical protein